MRKQQKTKKTITKILTTLIALNLLIGFSACKVKIDEDISDVLDKAIDNNSSSNGENEEDKSNNGKAKGKNKKADKDKEKNNEVDIEDRVVNYDYEGSNQDDEDTGGGIIVTEPNDYNYDYEEDYFMGTYALGTNSGNYYDDYTSRCNSEYNFPEVIRAYSHLDDEFIDFETNTGELAWIAEKYPDETFDFSVRFMDIFGEPSIQLNCTCEIAEGYGNYYNDEIQCDCGGDDSCSLYYTKK